MEGTFACNQFALAVFTFSVVPSLFAETIIAVSAAIVGGIRFTIQIGNFRIPISMIPGRTCIAAIIPIIRIFYALKSLGTASLMQIAVVMTAFPNFARSIIFEHIRCPIT